MAKRKTRDERIELQDDDPGDPDDMVIVTEKRWSTHYHEDQECRFLPDEDETIDVKRSRAQREWKAPCSECILDS